MLPSLTGDMLNSSRTCLLQWRRRSSQSISEGIVDRSGRIRLHVTASSAQMPSTWVARTEFICWSCFFLLRRDLRTHHIKPRKHGSFEVFPSSGGMSLLKSRCFLLPVFDVAWPLVRFPLTERKSVAYNNEADQVAALFSALWKNIIPGTGI